MKYLFLVWSNVWRKRTRAVLILLQVSVAFTLFGVLQGLDTGIKQAMAKAHTDRMYVISRLSSGFPYGDALPAALISEIGRVSGVHLVSYEGGLLGTYQKPDQQVYANAIDAANYARIFSETQIPKGELDALIRTRSGALVGAQLMRHYGWKVGQRITLQTVLVKADGSSDWSFDIVGTFNESDDPERADILLINFDYLNETRATNRDTVNDFVVQIDDPKRSASIGHEIDTLFVNSAHETRTQSEADLGSMVQRIGDLDFFAHVVTVAAFCGLLLATGALMMQTVRERTRELAVLKTVGFSDRRVMVLILLEAMFLFVLGAAIGLAMAGFALPRVQQLVVLGYLPRAVVAAGFAFAVFLAFVSGAIPAWRGLKLQVATALSRG